MFGSCIQMASGTQDWGFAPSPSTTTLDAAGALTISANSHLVAGYGGNDDTVASVVADSSMIGKIVILRRTGDDNITFTASVIQSAVDITLNHDDDCLVLQVTAANTVKVVTYFSAGG